VFGCALPVRFRILRFYIDDLVITGADLEEINRVKRQLAASFEMKDLGDLHYFLGIEVIRTPEGILMIQRH
jgi:ribosome maturation factor RimP